MTELNNTDSFVSPELVELFNKAAELARNNEYTASLETYNSIFEKRNPDGKPLVFTGRFAGIVYLRKAWVLMDIKKYEEAKKIFEDEKVISFFSQFNPKDLYGYYYSYANTLGNMHCKKEKMITAFNKAMNIANDMGDKALYTQAEEWLHYHLENKTTI